MKTNSNELTDFQDRWHWKLLFVILQNIGILLFSYCPTKSVIQFWFRKENIFLLL